MLGAVDDARMRDCDECEYYKQCAENVETNIFDSEEIHHNCTVQILHNSVTGEQSIGWWHENEPPREG
ncbi:MAG: hypothetical protein II338_03910, partial [Bacteroidaceae bacterium]|nr:hypothetical protein [Bacteroidaceae bacterium]